MTPEQITDLVREQGPYVFDRMFGAMEKVRERLERACRALNEANVPYAVIGGNAVAAWVATRDEGAIRNTQDVDILLRPEDADRATEALAKYGFLREKVFDVTMFLVGPDGKPSHRSRHTRGNTARAGSVWEKRRRAAMFCSTSDIRGVQCSHRENSAHGKLDPTFEVARRQVLSAQVDRRVDAATLALC